MTLLRYGSRCFLILLSHFFLRKHLYPRFSPASVSRKQVWYERCYASTSCLMATFCVDLGKSSKVVGATWSVLSSPKITVDSPWYSWKCSWCLQRFNTFVNDNDPVAISVFGCQAYIYFTLNTCCCRRLIIANTNNTCFGRRLIARGLALAMWWCLVREGSTNFSSPVSFSSETGYCSDIDSSVMEAADYSIHWCWNISWWGCVGTVCHMDRQTLL